MLPHVRNARARYTLVPILFLTTALLVLASGQVGTRLSQCLRGTALLWVTGLLVTSFSFTSERSLGPRWQPELANARNR